ncbi:MAG: hypothetical protein ACLFQM_04595 [Fidelibacterota bacterium]
MEHKFYNLIFLLFFSSLSLTKFNLLYNYLKKLGGTRSDEFFGTGRLESLIRESSIHSAEHSANLYIERLIQWSGKSKNTSLDDDLTLMIIDMV